MGKARFGWVAAAVGVLLITAVPATAGTSQQVGGPLAGGHRTEEQQVGDQLAGDQGAVGQLARDQRTGDQGMGEQLAVDQRYADQAAFDRLHDRQAKAWAEENGAAFAATYTEDGDVVTFNGEHLHGREGIARGMQYYFDNYIDGSRIKRLGEKVRYLDRDTVLIIRSSCLTQGDVPDCRPDSHSTNTNLLVRRHGQWLQESFQNTRYFEIP